MNTNYNFKCAKFVIVFFAIIVIATLFCSCKKTDNDIYKTRPGGSAFVSKEVVYSTDNDFCEVLYVDEYKDDYIAIVKEFETVNSLTEIKYEAVLFNSEETIETVPLNLNGNNYSTFLGTNSYVLYTEDNHILSMNLDTREKSLFYDGLSQEYVCKLLNVEDEIISLSFDTTNICYIFRRFDKHGTVVNEVTINNMDLLIENPLIEVDGELYVLLSTSYYPEYYEFSWKDGIGVKKSQLQNREFSLVEICGPYLYNSCGVYKYCPSTDMVHEIMTYAESNILPAHDLEVGLEKTQVINDNKIIISRAYSDGTIEFIIAEYVGELDKREIIVIGGYDASNDPIIKMAVYKFNNSQEIYRAVIEEYNVKYEYQNGYEASNMQLKIISDFEKNGPPDIYYGSGFDFVYMGENDSVIDLTDYIADSSIDFTDNISSVISDEKCYQVFHSYDIEGYVGLSSFFTSPYQSYKDVEKKSVDNGVPVYFQKWAYDVFDQTLRYELTALLGSGILVEPSLVEDLLEYSFNQGFEVNYVPTRVDSVDNLYLGYSLLSRAYIRDLYSFNTLCSAVGQDLIFVGFPSVGTSYHMLNPFGEVAISSLSDKKDACWEIIKLMFDEDVQDSIINYGEIPVINASFNNMIDAQIEKYDIDEHIVEVYINAINCVDIIKTMDWGVFSIIYEEIATLTTEGRDLHSIAETLSSRINVYIDENYS